MSILSFDFKTNEKIWGKEEWIISSHKNGMSFINNGEYKGLSLEEFYKNNKELFGIDDEEFPLLIKIIDAKDDLSIQVHPDDDYAKANENSLGKSESWYILDTNNSDIVVGQTARSKEEMALAIKEEKVMDKMNVFNINKGDFFYIKPGTVHSIRKNTKLLEVQQSSDITYRLYDYNRLGDDGKLRELHIDKSLDVIDYNDSDTSQNFKVIEKNSDYSITELANNDLFNVLKIDLNNEINIDKKDKYYMLILVEGKATINDKDLDLNEGVLVLKDTEIKIKGDGILILANN